MGAACFSLFIAAAGAGSSSEPPAQPEEVIRDLESQDRRTRLEAALRLGDIGERAAGAVPALTRALSDPDPAIRFQVVYALGRIGRKAEAAIPALRAIEEKDPSEDVRDAAARAIRRIQSPQPAPAKEDPRPNRKPVAGQDDDADLAWNIVSLCIGLIPLAVLLVVLLIARPYRGIWTCRRCGHAGRARLYLPMSNSSSSSMDAVHRCYFGCAHCGSNDIEPAESPLAPGT